MPWWSRNGSPLLAGIVSELVLGNCLFGGRVLLLDYSARLAGIHRIEYH